MAILNATPDSFFADSRALADSSLREEQGDSQVDSIEQRIRCIIKDGADIIDIGGESSRPGADYIEAEREIERVVPLIKAVRALSDIPVSIDTRKAIVAKAALDAGADIINDISALGDDPELAPLAAEYGVPVILMHKRGIPSNMQKHIEYSDVVSEVCSELHAAAQTALDAGIASEKIILDPGIGFGKTVEQNFRLLAESCSLAALGYPLLLGHSRKSFIGAVTDISDADGRLAGSLAAGLIGAMEGYQILRVHDVAETKQTLQVLAAFRSQGGRL